MQEGKHFTAGMVASSDIYDLAPRVDLSATNESGLQVRGERALCDGLKAIRR